jgi:hypothetical protein
MVCINCQEMIGDDEYFCGKCGSPINRDNNLSSATYRLKERIINFVRKKSGKMATDLNRHAKYPYREAMKYFIDHKTDDPNIAKGAMVLERLSQGYQIYEVFLDRNNNLIEDEHGCPLGFKLKIDGMDEELSELFSKTNVVFVE